LTDEIVIFSTCPSSADHDVSHYLDRIREVSRWSEEAGCSGMLVYSDNRLADPWLVSHAVIQATERLRPLLALQPVYMHPFNAAKAIATLSGWYRRVVDLNLLAGGFKRDLEALGDPTPHDDRYARLEEYTRIVVGILRESAEGRGFSFKGRFYEVENLRLTLPFDAAMMPRLLVSGTSPSGRACARALGAVPVEYPLPAASYADEAREGGARGLRVGIIARETEAEAWAVAEARFPADRRGEISHKMAMKVSDSDWHRRLSEAPTGAPGDPFWLRPFQSYQTFCPYLVGSFERIAAEIGRYVQAGFSLFILDIPATPDELRIAGEVFRRAREAQAA
jgi:alkanesulfonate monooxygenase